MNIGTNFSTRIRLADVVFSTTQVSHTSRHAITRLRVRRLQSHGGDEGIDHPARTHYVGKGMELMDPLKAHGNVTGYIHPQRHIVLFTRGPVYRQAGGYVACFLHGDLSTDRQAGTWRPASPKLFSLQ